jgi:hypothetical protein
MMVERGLGSAGSGQGQMVGDCENEYLVSFNNW